MGSRTRVQFGKNPNRMFFGLIPSSVCQNFLTFKFHFWVSFRVGTRKKVFFEILIWQENFSQILIVYFEDRVVEDRLVEDRSVFAH